MIISFDMWRERNRNVKRQRFKKKTAIRRLLYLIEPVKTLGYGYINRLHEDNWKEKVYNN